MRVNSTRTKRLKKIGQRLQATPIAPKSVDAALVHFRATGELPDQQRIAYAVTRKALYIREQEAAPGEAARWLAEVYAARVRSGGRRGRDDCHRRWGPIVCDAADGCLQQWGRVRWAEPSMVFEPAKGKPTTLTIRDPDGQPLSGRLCYFTFLGLREYNMTAYKERRPGILRLTGAAELDEKGRVSLRVPADGQLLLKVGGRDLAETHVRLRSGEDRALQLQNAAWIIVSRPEVKVRVVATGGRPVEFSAPTIWMEPYINVAGSRFMTFRPCNPHEPTVIGPLPGGTVELTAGDWSKKLELTPGKVHSLAD